MIKKRTLNLKLDRQTVRLWQILGIFLLIALLLRFEAVAGPVARVIAPNDPGMTDKLMNWGGIAQNLLIGWILISIGAKLSVVPWIGVPFMLVGATLVIYAFWKIYKGKAPTGTGM